MSEVRWRVYLLECADGTLYCGVTVDLAKRLEAHNQGQGAAYTRGRRPVRLAALCPRDLTRAEALRLERQVKSLPRHRKAEFLKAGGY